MTFKQNLASPIFMVICVVLSTTLGCESNGAAGIEFNDGRSALMKGQYELAEKRLSAFTTNRSSHPLGSRAWFLRAKAQVGIGDLDQASSLFQETIRRFPASEEAHKSRYKLAYIKLLQGDQVGARQAFQEVIDRSPGTLVPEANAMVRMLSQEPAAVLVQPVELP